MISSTETDDFNLDWSKTCTESVGLDNTCRARWPEGLLCSTISLKSCNLAQILQSPKSEIVTCVMFSTHTNTSLIKPHLTELDEIHRNRPKSNYNLAKNLQSWSFLERYIGQTHGQTEIHTFFIWHPRVGREHNSPSGKNVKSHKIVLILIEELDCIKVIKEVWKDSFSKNWKGSAGKIKKFIESPLFPQWSTVEICHNR